MPSKTIQTLFLSDKKNNLNKIIYPIIDLVFIIIITAIIYFFIEFKLGQYLFSGDFRFHINNDFVGDQFLSLVSKRFSSNNFVFLAFYPIFYLLQYVPYHYMLIYVFFGIPIGLFLSIKFVLTKLTSFKYDNIQFYLLISSISSYVAVNPSLFSRFPHWPILHGAIFFPLYMYLLYKYLQKNNFLNQYLWMLPIMLFFGAITPHLVVIYFASSILLYLTVLFAYKKKLWKYLIKGFLIALTSIVSFLQVLYPIAIGYGRVKSAVEGETTSYVFSSLARNSNVFSAISGTNYYEGLIEFPVDFSAGFLIFLLSIFFLLIYKKRDKLTTILIFFTLLGLIDVAGYPAFSWIFDLLGQTFISDLLWIVKDPNTYYLFFLMILVLLFARLVAINQVKKPYMLSMAIVILVFNIVFLFGSDRTSLIKQNIQFVDLPKEYLALANTLRKDPRRNLWLPSEIYVSKSFSKEIHYFPSPPYWLTSNKELFEATKDYKNLIDTIEEEIYEKECTNINFLNWIIAAQNLNVIIDRNSVE